MDIDIAKLHAGAHALTRKNPSLRYGQALFNYLYEEMDRDLAEEIGGTDADPFYDDTKVAAFFRAISEKTQQPILTAQQGRKVCADCREPFSDVSGEYPNADGSVTCSDCTNIRDRKEDA